MNRDIADLIVKNAIYVDGPHGSFVVYDMKYVEAMIKAMCKINGDDTDEYTATNLNKPSVV